MAMTPTKATASAPHRAAVDPIGVPAGASTGTPSYGIGELAKRARVSIDTVRFYERNDLLAPTHRLPSGYRRYDEHQVRRLRFIRRAKALGFSLGEIRELITLSEERSVGKVKRAASARLADVEAKIRELERIRDGLRELVIACPGHGRAESCPILNALQAEDAK